MPYCGRLTPPAKPGPSPGYQHIISDVLHFDDVEAALKLAATPGAADKVVVTFG